MNTYFIIIFFFVTFVQAQTTNELILTAIEPKIESRFSLIPNGSELAYAFNSRADFNSAKFYPLYGVKLCLKSSLKKCYKAADLIELNELKTG